MGTLALTIMAEVATVIATVNVGLAILQRRSYPMVLAILSVGIVVYFTARVQGWSL